MSCISSLSQHHYSDCQDETLAVLFQFGVYNLNMFREKS